jgi:hypothetical protein
MKSVALHMRIAAAQVTDEDVDRRMNAISDLAADFGKIKKPSEMFGVAADVAQALTGDGVPSDSLGEQVEAFLQPHASAFIYKERPLEVGICSGLAAQSLITDIPIGKDAWSAADVMAAALWSALSFQSKLSEPRREALRLEVLSSAQDRVIRAAEGARTRLEVPDFGTLNIAPEDFTKFNTSFRKASVSTIDSLRKNAALDREELDFLWWVMLDRSRLLKESLMQLEEPVRAVAAGIEAAEKLRKLPCDVHYELVVRTISEDSKLDLAELLVAIGGHREILVASFPRETLDSAPGVFPLLLALSSGNAVVDGADVRRTASEWGSRALLEAAIMRMQSGNAGNL